VNETAFRLVQESTGGAAAPVDEQAIFRRMMREIGSKGGKVGGKARAEKLTQSERSKIASIAAKKRWGASKKES